jgi:hypothetical protein
VVCTLGCAGKKFASEALRKQVESLRAVAEDLSQLNTRRKGKLLVLEVGARITSANQKWIETLGDEDDGVDMMVEFTDEDGNGMGAGVGCALVNLQISVIVNRYNP